jgi:hypothetical protein
MGCTFPKKCPKKVLKTVGPRPANLSTALERAHVILLGKGNIVRIIGIYEPVEEPLILQRLPPGIRADLSVPSSW